MKTGAEQNGATGKSNVLLFSIIYPITGDY